MAAVYTNVTIAGQTKEAIIVSGTGATEKIILKDQLSDYDLTQMDLISETTGDGITTFADKMAATTLANGQLASVQYADFIKNTVAYSEAVALAGLSLGDIKAAILDLQADVADHENRIVALEPSP